MTVTATAKPKSPHRSGGSTRARVIEKRVVRVVAPPAVTNRGVPSKSPLKPIAPTTSPSPSPVSYTCHRDSETVRLPRSVTDLASFRLWATSDAAPERTPVFFLSGEVWIDMSQEQLFSHNQLKLCLALILAPLSKQQGGRYIPDGMLLSNERANLSGNPDGLFVTHARLRGEQVRLVDGAKSGCVELEGTPDMVLEVVSDSSVQKDTAILRDLYWKAGIPEYWIVDGRHDAVEFTILKHTTRGYSAVRNAAGWLKSPVFGKSFRLTRRLDELGHPDFVLDVK